MAWAITAGLGITGRSVSAQQPGRSPPGIRWAGLAGRAPATAGLLRQASYGHGEGQLPRLPSTQGDFRQDGSLHPSIGVVGRRLCLAHRGSGMNEIMSGHAQLGV